jgi:UDP-glucose 4-epimerase
MSFGGKNVLVTGGAGFIGSHLVDGLVNQGANVTILDNLSTGSKKNLNPKARFLFGGVEDVQVVRKSMEDIELVYHLAADATTRESSVGWDTPHRTLEHNVIGTLNVFRAIAERHLEARVIFASSAAVYGEPVFTPIAESHPTNPISPYGISKLAGEKLALAYFKEFGIDAVALRIFNTYGPRQPRYVIFELLKKLQTNQARLQVLGTPITVRDYCYVSDMVDALLLAGVKGVGGQVYNVSGETPVTMGDLVQILLHQLGLAGSTRVRFTGRSWKGDITKMVADISRIRDLGFRPSVDLKEGIRLMIDSEWWESASKGQTTSTLRHPDEVNSKVWQADRESSRS